MKINVWYDDLPPSRARQLIALLAAFEEGESQSNALPTAQHESAPTDLDTPKSQVAPRKRGRPPKALSVPAMPTAPTPTAPTPTAPTPTREALLAQLRDAVQNNYEMCEAWLDARGRPGFTALDLDELREAVEELCS